MDHSVLDLKGLKCPLPALKLRKALKAMARGAVVVVDCTDPLSAIDIPNLLRETGDELLGEERNETVLRFTVRKS